jgi:hypothetical protein
MIAHDGIGDKIQARFSGNPRSFLAFITGFGGQLGLPYWQHMSQLLEFSA